VPGFGVKVGINNFDDSVTCRNPDSFEKQYKIGLPFCVPKTARTCATDYKMENCNILAVPGCATDSTTCNDTKYEIFVAVATAISQIISMIAFPGAGVIAKFIELGLQIIDLCKNVYDFLKKRIEVI